MEQAKACAEANDRSFSADICKAVQFYRDNQNVIRPDNKEIWANFIAQASKEELMALSTFICGINDEIIRKCQKV